MNINIQRIENKEIKKVEEKWSGQIKIGKYQKRKTSLPSNSFSLC